MVNHPSHYNSHPSGIECIEITRYYCFAIGSAIKYLWREAQEYISRRGFDIPWNDCDVFVNERAITQTVANVLKWADDNPDKHTSDTDVIIEKARKWFEKQNEWFDPNGNRHCDMESFEDFVNYMKGE